MLQTKWVQQIGWLASLMALAMYMSYIDQIRLNLAGNAGSIWLPCMTILNCTLWTAYGWLHTPKQWPIIVCNIPGIVLGFITLLTAVY